MFTNFSFLRNVVLSRTPHTGAAQKHRSVFSKVENLNEQVQII